MNNAKFNHAWPVIVGLMSALLLACASQPPSQPAHATTTIKAAPDPVATKTIVPRADVDRVLGEATRYYVPVDDLPCRGPSDALVTLVEYTDYASEFVRRLQPPLTRLFREQKGLRHCVAQAPVRREHPMATFAAEAGLEAYRQRGQLGFFLFHDALLKEVLTQESILRAASVADLDVQELERALKLGTHQETWQANWRRLKAMRMLSIPSVFINGRYIPGARPLERYLALVGDERSRAQDLRSMGFDNAAIYQEVLARGVHKRQRPGPRSGEPKEVCIRVISLMYGGAGLGPADRTRQQALKIAEEVAARLAAGDSFADLARMHSNSSIAKLGGDRGCISRGFYSKNLVPIEDAAFKLAVGEKSKMVEAEKGFGFVLRYR